MEYIKQFYGGDKMDMNEHFDFAEVANNNEAKQLLTEFENKLGEKVGGEVVLVACKRKHTDGSWH